MQLRRAPTESLTVLLDTAQANHHQWPVDASSHAQPMSCLLFHYSLCLMRGYCLAHSGGLQHRSCAQEATSIR